MALTRFSRSWLGRLSRIHNKRPNVEPKTIAET
jgi:hypothetical protein